MPKTKQQKQKEAIERARKYLPTARAEWFKYQIGGGVYEKVAKANKEYAEKLRIEANINFDKACERANTDTHGNPI